MKCVKDTVSGRIVRLDDEEADRRVRTYPAIFAYCSKEEWKKQEAKDGK